MTAMSYFKPKVNVWFLEPVPRAELFYLCNEQSDVLIARDRITALQEVIAFG